MWVKTDGGLWVFFLMTLHRRSLGPRGPGGESLRRPPEPDAVIDWFGGLRRTLARGVKLRHERADRSPHFRGSLGRLDIDDDAASVREPQGNGWSSA